MNLQRQAKEKSEKFLKSRNILVNPSLPLIEDPSEMKPQTAEAVARRSLVLGYMIGIAYEQSGSDLKSEMEKWNLYYYTSAKEKALLEKEQYSKQERINASWYAECIQALAWGLCMVELDHFRIYDDNLSSYFPIKNDPSAFIKSAKLRSFEEIYFQSDLIYRMHWAAVEARIKDKETILEEGIISERRKALDWMVGVESDWDEIPMDT